MDSIQFKDASSANAEPSFQPDFGTFIANLKPSIKGDSNLRNNPKMVLAMGEGKVDSGGSANVEAFTLIAESGSTVHAGEATVVTARLGSTVYAERGSTIYAAKGANIFAKEGSTVYALDGTSVNGNEKQTIHQEKGATVLVDQKSYKVSAYKDSVLTAHSGYISAYDGATIDVKYNWTNTTPDRRTASYEIQDPPTIHAKGQCFIYTPKDTVASKAGSYYNNSGGVSIEVESGANATIMKRTK